MFVLTVEHQSIAIECPGGPDIVGHAVRAPPLQTELVEALRFSKVTQAPVDIGELSGSLPVNGGMLFFILIGNGKEAVINFGRFAQFILPGKDIA